MMINVKDALGESSNQLEIKKSTHALIYGVMAYFLEAKF